MTLTALLIFQSCHNKKTIRKINPEFAKYVSGYTSGMISRGQTVRIELADQYGNPGGKDSSLSLFDVPDSNVLKGIFSFSPELKGKARWVNRRIIEFTPYEPMKPNQLYTAVFDLEKVAKVKKNFESFEFDFASFPIGLTVNSNGLTTRNDYSSDFYKLTGSVSTSDYVAPEELKRVLKATLNGKECNISWTSSSYNSNMYYFTVDSIQKAESKGQLKLLWNGATIGSKDEGEDVIMVPAFGDFTVGDAVVVDEKNQVLQLSFTDPLQWKQDLNGMITLEGFDKLNYTIEGNTVKIYIDKRITGTREVVVHKGVKNFKGYGMSESYNTTVEFEAVKPQVKLIGNGTILPNSGGLIFPFEAVALKKVDVRVIKIKETNVHQFLQVNNLDGRDELSRIGTVIAEKTIDLNYRNSDLRQWATHVIDLTKLIVPEPGAIYRVGIKFRKEYAICDCEEFENDTYYESDGSNQDNLWSENGWDSYSFDDGYEPWYYYSDRSSPCTYSYYRSKSVSRNILASDIGLVYKLEENKTAHVFVTSMITTEPIEGCKVEYFDYTKNVVAEGYTDSNGMLDVQLTKKPFLMIASFGNQRGYLKLGDAYSNSVSKFDVEGTYSQKGVKGFIYGERGVWRPGDSIYLNFMLEDQLKQIPEGFPVKFELLDPQGSVVVNMTRNASLNGVYDFRTATSPDAVTGNYMAVVKVGNSSFSQNIKVETVKPNRLKIYLDVYNNFIENNNKDTLGELNVKWLHGAVASKMKANVSVTFSNTETSFKGYKNYIFDSPVRNFSSNEYTVFSDRLDENGHAYVKRSFGDFKGASGMLKAKFVSRVFEEGGDFSIDVNDVTYSPFKDYVGIRIPDLRGNGGMFETGQNYKLDVAVLKSNGKASDVSKVNAKIFRIKRYWWYEDEDNLSDYVSRGTLVQIMETDVQLKNGKGVLSVNFQDDQYGRYLVLVEDPEGGHQTGTMIDVEWPYSQRGNNVVNENARMLHFTADKESYKTGDKIKLTIPSQAGGRALVSVENRSKIIQKFWVNTKANETHCDLLVTPEMAPNVYVHVTFLQPHAFTKNDLPIRMYGILPVTVFDPQTIIKPLLASNEEWTPETDQYVTVSETDGKDMTYTLAVVDEGLLDLTRFKTPNPWSKFYAKEALGIKTWDMYDHVIGAFAGKIDKLLSIGGDESAINTESAKANRFKPMVRFIGPFHLGAGKKARHKIDVPNYIGSVRIMLVARNGSAYGNAEKTVKVKKPLMVLATLPRVIGPGETVALPVNVFAMEDNIKDVSIRVESSDNLQMLGSAQQNIRFNHPGDEVVNFNLQVAKSIGIASVRVVATSGGIRSDYTVEIDIRPSNPRVTDVQEWAIQPGKSLSEAMKFKGLTGSNQLKIEVSNIVPIGLSRRLDYLIQYPHGCLEQTTSSVFPQLFVSRVMVLSPEKREEISSNIKAGIKRLMQFQNGMGGFGYWPGENETNEWGTNYAASFLIEAEQQGYVIPELMKKRLIKYMSNKAKLWNPNGNYSNQMYQAGRLYLLALAKAPEMGAMNRMKESGSLNIVSKFQLAEAYYLAGQKDAAAQLVKNFNGELTKYRELSYSFGSTSRDEALMLGVYGTMGIKNTVTEKMMTNLSKRLNSELWLSTQETAYGLMSLIKYFGGNATAATTEFKLNVNGSSSSEVINRLGVYQYEYSDKKLPLNSKFSLLNNGKTVLYVKLISEYIPLGDDAKSENNGIALNVVYKDKSGNVLDPGKIVQGTDFLAEVTVTNQSKLYLEELALTQIFPSGWEIRNTRMEDNYSTSGFRYQDFRDDRVYTYYSLPSKQKKTFVIQLNAAYIGKYYLPSVYTEAMYDKSYNSKLGGRWVEVKRPDDKL